MRVDSDENADGDTGSDNDSTVESTNQWSAARLHQASYKDLGSPSQVQERFTQHVLHHCNVDLKQLLQESSVTTRDYSICIDAFALIQADPVLGVLLIRYPATLLPLLESAIVRAQQTLQEQRQESEATATQPEDDIPLPAWSVKGGTAGNESTAATRVHARLVHLPPTCGKVSLGRCLSAKDVGKIWQVSGTVVRTGPVQMYESARTYKCCGVTLSSGGGGRGGRGGRRGGGGANRENGPDQQQPQEKPYCGRTFILHADVEQRNNALLDPEICPGTLPNGDRCPGNKFELVEGGSVHTDYQEIKIQDAASSAGGVGHIPRSLLIKLQHDLVDHCQPGDEVVVVGILLAQWQQPSLAEDMECHVNMAMSAHSVRVICEKGSSVWKGDGGTARRADNSIGERDQYEKEFLQFWNEDENVQYPIAARDFICKAVCVKLYGMQVIKLGLLLTLIGGVSSDVYEDHGPVDDASLLSNVDASIDTDRGSLLRRNEPDPFQLVREATRKNTSAAYHDDAFSAQPSSRPEKVKTRRRDQSHCLLVGDPGTGKSQFLRFAAALCPRSVLTTGVGTTSAGLTCAAVRDGSSKEFALEAGALVLADKGVCCIDEFGCIRESDRTTIHEAMEQQTLSVAKAGIVCKLNCRATIIAVMNPRNCLYDNHSSLAANTGLGTPLLSRFDLIFKLVDTSDAERDNNVTTYLLNRAILGAGVVSHTNGNDVAPPNRTPWSMEKLRAYVSVIKDRFQPAMSDDAALLLERHYEKCRSTPCNTIPVTVRFLESLIRLSQAHAKLMHRIGNTVTLQDAVAVIQVMECTAFACGGFDGVGVYDSHMYQDPMTIDFSPEPDLDFVCFEYRLLERYNMLDSMDKDRKANALAAFGTDDEPNGGETGWHDLENHQFSGINRNHSDQAPQEPTHPSITQDHYGRFQGSSQPQNKRRRR